MPVCQFFLRGQCKFGNMCKNEHPAQRPGGFGSQSWNSSSQQQNGPLTIPFSLEGMTKDLTPGSEKPTWPLSSYATAKMEPTLFSGLDESPEELRVRAAQALKSGNVADYQKYETEKIQAADQTYSNALSNINQVFKQAHDMAVAAQKGLSITTAQAIIQPQAQGSAFGKPSAFGAFGGAPSAFGGAAGPSGSAFGSTAPGPASAFGKPAFTQSAFGQPAFGQSTFGQAQQKPVSAFAPSQPAPAASAFGQPPAVSSAFGSSQMQPAGSVFGQPSQPQSAFAKPASGFGAFGNTTATNSSTPAAGSTSAGGFAAFAAGGTSAFSSGSQNSSVPVFGRSAFGGAATSAPISAFANTGGAAPAGGVSAFGATGPINTPSAFGTPAAGNQPVSAFSQAAKPASAFNAFATGQASQPVSAFGQPQSAPGFGATQSQSAFGQPQSTAFSANALPSKPRVGPPDFQAALTAAKAQPGKDKYDGLLPPNYIELLPAPTREAFESAKFEWGKIPDWIPPVQLR